MNDILLYRLLAEHRVQQKEVVPAGNAEAVQASSEAARSVEDFSLEVYVIVAPRSPFGFHITESAQVFCHAGDAACIAGNKAG